MNTTLLGTILGNTFFILYLELNPFIKNIWYRKDQTGNYEINFLNIIPYYYEPLTSIMFWNPIFWDLNPYIYTFGTILITHSIEYYLHH